MSKEIYDVAIIGTGLTGLSAAMYSGRFNLKTIVFGELLGGTITSTDLVENYPGFKSIKSYEMVDKFLEHANDYDVKIKYEKVKSIIKEKDLFKVEHNSGTILSKTIIIATGSKVKKLNAPGEDIFANKGIGYCALCDGAFYKDKVVAVIGGGDSAAVDALLLTQFAKKVYVIVRKDHMRAEPSNQEKLNSNEKIEIIYNTNVIEFLGDEKLEKLKLDNPYNGKDEIEIDGCFIAIGHSINNELPKSLGVDINEKGEIKIDRNAKTNVPGVYAAGDCVDSDFKQVITGAAEAVLASHSAYKYVTK
ncbi:MAG: NAD(P)/FAD-dependent oxidoreductase [Candidatus Woesearchaeota archaeon]